MPIIKKAVDARNAGVYIIIITTRDGHVVAVALSLVALENFEYCALVLALVSTEYEVAVMKSCRAVIT